MQAMKAVQAQAIFTKNCYFLISPKLRLNVVCLFLNNCMAATWYIFKTLHVEVYSIQVHASI